MGMNVPKDVTDSFQNALGNFLARWVGFICAKAVVVISLSTIMTIALAYYTATVIGISTDTTDMLSPKLPFRQNAIALSKAFPQNSDNIVVVIDGPNADLINEAADQIAVQLRKQPKLFGEVFDPAGMGFFKTNGLMYLKNHLQFLEQFLLKSIW